MNKLQRDIRRRTIAQLAVVISFLLTVLIQGWAEYVGLTQHEFFDKYPVIAFIAWFLALIFLGSLFYSAKKTIDTNPRIQLRSEADEVLERLLADPGYQLWHREAQRLLDQRRKTQLDAEPKC